VGGTVTITMEELARRLRLAREACGLKQEEVARRLGISRPAVAQMEGGQRKVSSLELDRLAHLYGREIRDFLAPDFSERDALTALFRRHSDLLSEDSAAEALRKTTVVAQELTNLEELLGLERDFEGLPSYAYGRPRTKGEAVRQGEEMAIKERRRLELGSAPIPSLATLLENLGIRTAQLALPDDISGLTLVDRGIGIFIAVNNREPQHSRWRRRFSYAHEYCHALVDRHLGGTVSRAAARDELVEVRANAFAAAFLMPEEGVRMFLHRLGKARGGRMEVELYDEEGLQRVEVRPRPGSRSVRMHDVVLLAHHFGVSRLAALFRLKSLRLVRVTEFEQLRAQEVSGIGRDIQTLLGFEEPEPEKARTEFRSRFLALAFEAFRREEITYGKLRDLVELVGVSKENMDAVVLHLSKNDRIFRK